MKFDRRVFWTLALTTMLAPFSLGCGGGTSTPAKGKSGTEKHDEHDGHKHDDPDHGKPGHKHEEGEHKN